jgi:hypothetical protein
MLNDDDDDGDNVDDDEINNGGLRLQATKNPNPFLQT